MKCRNSFVTNSSSSSFVINLSELTDYTIEVFKNPILVADQLIPTKECSRDEYMEYAKDWDIRVEDGKLWGYTTMDNFDYSQIFYICGLDFDTHRDQGIAPSLADEMRRNVDKFFENMGDEGYESEE